MTNNAAGVMNYNYLLQFLHMTSYFGRHTFIGATHGAERNLLRCSWSGDGGLVSCGSASRAVNIWNSTSEKLLYCLGGHKGSVNEVVFHPSEPVVASCSTDKQIFLGELGELLITA